MIDVTPDSITAVVVGIMQDGGLPHIGCRCVYCRQGRIEYAACLALIDSYESPAKVWLIDATPDIKYQFNWLAPVLGTHRQRPHRLRQPNGIFLTHAHMGHIGGLPQLGPEALAAQRLPIMALPALLMLLKETPLWRPLLAQLQLTAVYGNQPLILTDRLTVTPIPVPHRDEWGVGTVAYRVQGPDRSLLYLPDIDGWALWPAAEAHLTAVDYALVDASFYSIAELNGRESVSHPLIPQTVALWADLPTQLILTHFNHTNPVLDLMSDAAQTVLASGVQLASMGQCFWL